MDTISKSKLNKAKKYFYNLGINVAFKGLKYMYY